MSVCACPCVILPFFAGAGIVVWEPLMQMVSSVHYVVGKLRHHKIDHAVRRTMYPGYLASVKRNTVVV